MTTRRRSASILLSRDWLLAALAVLLAAVVCVGLGAWQYGRFQDKQERRDLITANMRAAPVPLEELLPSEGSAVPAGAQWRTVRLTGRYCTEPRCVLYVRNRSLNGQVGFWQLVPFRTDSGTLLVVRGWVPMQSTRSQPQDPPPVPPGEVTLTARLRPAEPVLRGRTNPPGQVQTVTPAAISGQLPDLPGLRTEAYGELVKQTPASSPAPYAVAPPEVDLGPHLAYAVQWWLFAMFFPVAWVIRARAALREASSPTGADPPRSEAHPGSGTPPGSESTHRRAHAPQGTARAAPGARRHRSRSRDEEEEDAILDGRSPL